MSIKLENGNTAFMMAFELRPGVSHDRINEELTKYLVKKHQGALTANDVDIISPVLNPGVYDEAYRQISALAGQEGFGWVVLDQVNAIIRTFKDARQVDRAVRVISLPKGTTSEVAGAIEAEKEKDLN